MVGRPNGCRRKAALAVPVAWAAAQLYDLAISGIRLWLSKGLGVNEESARVLLERDLSWIWKDEDE